MWSKVASKCGPSMLRNIIGPHFDSRNGVFFSLFLLVFLKNLILPAERRRFLKNKTEKKEKTWTTFWLKKGKSWTTFWLYSIYIYIYIYMSPLPPKCIRIHIWICVYIYTHTPTPQNFTPYFICLFHERKRAQLHLRGNSNQSLLTW